jgi:hypothetical protein
MEEQPSRVGKVGRRAARWKICSQLIRIKIWIRDD